MSDNEFDNDDLIEESDEEDIDVSEDEEETDFKEKPKLVIEGDDDVDDDEVDEDKSIVNEDGEKEVGEDDDIVDDDDEAEGDDDEEDGEGDESNNGEYNGGNKTEKKKDVLISNKEDDEEDDDEEDDDYLQKFDSEVNKNYLLDFHPECSINNYDEIASLSVVTRDKNNNIIDDLHKTIPYLTKYEKSRIIGQRAKQINSGAKTFVKVPENIIDGYLIAELELIQKRIPFIIRRPIFGGGCEYWRVQDLENIGF